MKGKYRFLLVGWLYLLTLSKGKRIALFCALYLLLLMALPEPDTFVVFQGRSESVEYEVSNPPQAAFKVACARLLTDDDASRQSDCLSGLVQPPKKAKVRYLRHGNGPLIISVQPTKDPHSRINTHKETFDVKGDFALLQQTHSAQEKTERFPVWGPVEIGEQLWAATLDGEPPHVLLSGKLTVYGRSFSLPLLGPRSGLYHVSTLELPAGARLLTERSVPDTDTSVRDGRDQWWGMVFADTEGGLGTTLSTETPRVLLFPPGSREAPDVIEVGLFAQATGDPVIVALQAVLVALFSIYQLAGETKPGRNEV